MKKLLENEPTKAEKANQDVYLENVGNESAPDTQCYENLDEPQQTPSSLHAQEKAIGG
jgi:hypothetical protein